MNLDARLKRLEKQLAQRPVFVVLFGDDPEPINLPVDSTILRLHEALRNT